MEDKPQHTPGPWKVGTKVKEIQTDGFPVVGKYMDDGRPYYTDWYIADVKTEANARLIALAPRMFELLKNLAQELYDEVYGEHSSGPWETSHPFYFEAQKIIAEIEK